jgi:ECF sigma factor
LKQNDDGPFRKLLFSALMSDVSPICNALEHGDPHAAAQLLLFVYDKLRRLAAQKLAQEAPGRTLQATAPAHEAYVRLVSVVVPRRGTQKP